MQLYSIETGNLMLDGGAMFGVVPKTMWQKVYPADDNNLCNLSMRALLIIDEDKKILIDCGMGDKMDPSLAKYYFLNGDDILDSSLEAVGVNADEITDVVLTHLHFDHCGGLVKKDKKGVLKLAFKNAKHWVSKGQWEVATKPNRREKPSFIKENFSLVETEGKLFFPEEDMPLTQNVLLRQFNGHTKGLIVPQINYNGKTIVYTADFIPTSAHVPLSFICAYDIDPLQSLKEKEVFLDESIKNDYVYFFEHDINVECCSLIDTPKGVRVGEKFTLSEFVDKA